MFILPGFSRKTPFAVSRRNGLVTIECEDGPVVYRGTETRQPVQYLCRVRPEGSLDGEGIPTRSLEQSKVLAVETIYERERTAAHEPSYDRLIHDFGDRGSKERIKKREIGTISRVQSVQFNIGNQVLPDFDHFASDVKRIYKLELLFSEETVESFGRADVEFDDLCYLVKKNKFDGSNKAAFMAIDCLYKTLTARGANAVPRAYGFFADEIGDGVMNGRLSSLARDKLIVKTYILLLMVNDYTMHYDCFPKFEAGKSKVVGMLRAIGCAIDSAGVVTLSKQPLDTYSVK